MEGGDDLLLVARTQSYNVTSPFNAFDLLLKENGFIQAFSDKKVTEAGGKTNFYALGKQNVRMCLDQTQLRSVLTRACVLATGKNFVFKAGQVNPLIRLAEYGVPTAHLKICYKDDSIFKARLSLDLDCSATGALQPFPTAQRIFEVTCDFLQKYIDSENIQFAKEACSIFLGSNSVKNRTCHVIFHDLCFARDSSNILGKAHILSKLFNQPLEPLGFESDFSVCSSGLRYEFTDKYDVKQKCWRGCTNPYAGGFNYDNTAVLWDDLWDYIDPLVIESDPAWNREISWKIMEGAASKKGKPSSAVVISTPVVAPLAYAHDSVEERIALIAPGFQNVNFKRFDLGEGKLKLLPISNYCPFKSDPSSDHPAHEHSTSKVYIFVQPDQSATIHCAVCQGQTLEVAGSWYSTAREKEIISRFNKSFAIMQECAIQLPIVNSDGSRTEMRKLSYNSFLNATASNAFKIHAPVGKIGENQFWWGHESATRYPKGFIFDPSGTHPPGYLNKWTGFNPKMLKLAEEMQNLSIVELNDEWKLTKKLVETNICANDPIIAEQFFGYFKDMILYPERKPKWAFTLFGPQGLGKGLTMSFFLKMAGKHGVQTDGEAIIKKFNGHIMETVVLLIDEGMGKFNKAAAGKVKSFITEQTQEAEFKYADPYQCNNVTRVVVASNDKPDYIEEGDRRWCVLQCDFHWDDFKENRAAIAAECESLRGPAAFYLLTLRHGNYESFSFTDCVRTRSRWDLMYGQLDFYDNFVYHKFCFDEEPFLVSLPMFFEEKFKGFGKSFKAFTTPMPKTLVWNAFLEHNNGDCPRNCNESVLWKTLRKYLKKTDLVEQRLAIHCDVRSITLPDKKFWRSKFLKVHGLDSEIYDEWKK